MRECPTCGRLFNADDVEICPEDSARLVLMGEADPLLGRQVGSYRLERRLGRGGMGAVYAAVQPAIGSTVAIKILHRKYAVDPVMVERFFNEARAVNLIGHEHIVRIFDFGHLEDGTPYFVMELLKGWSLSELCGSSHPTEEVLPIILQIARALEAAHTAGVVHRDLKPDNVFIVNTDEGRSVKVLDFGIAKLMTLPGVTPTESGAIMGSARYLSPEQAAGEGDKVGPHSDIYSLGVMLFELLCGRLPFDAGNYGDLLVAQRTAKPPRPRALVSSIPVWLEDVILRCLAKNPEDRFASMTELIAALQPSAKQAAVSRRRLVVGLAAAASISGVLAVAATRESPRPPPPETAPAVAAAPMPVPVVAELTAAPDAGAVAVQAVAPPVVTTPRATVPKPRPIARKTSGPRYSIPEKVGDDIIEIHVE